MKRKILLTGAVLLQLSLVGCLSGSGEKSGLSGNNLVIVKGSLEVGRKVVFGMIPSIARSIQVTSAKIDAIGSVMGSCMAVRDRIECNFTESGPLTIIAQAQTSSSVRLQFQGDILDPNGLSSSAPKVVVSFEGLPNGNDIGSAATIRYDIWGNRRLERGKDYTYTFFAVGSNAGSRAKNYQLSQLVARIDLGDGNGMRTVSSTGLHRFTANWVGARRMTAELSLPNRRKTTRLEFDVMGFCLPTTNPISLNTNNISISQDIGNWHTINALPGISGGVAGANYSFVMDVNGDFYTKKDTGNATGAVRMPIIYEGPQSLQVLAMEDQCYSFDTGIRNQTYSIPRPARGGGDVWIRSKTRGIPDPITKIPNPRVNADRDVNVINMGRNGDPQLVTPIIARNMQTGDMTISIYGGANFFLDDPDRTHGVAATILGVKQTGANTFDTSNAYVEMNIRIDDVEKDAGEDVKLRYQEESSTCRLRDVNVRVIQTGLPCYSGSGTGNNAVRYQADFWIDSCVLKATDRLNRVYYVSAETEANLLFNNNDACAGGGGGGGGDPPPGY